MLNYIFPHKKNTFDYCGHPYMPLTQLLLLQNAVVISIACSRREKGYCPPCFPTSLFCTGVKMALSWIRTNKCPSSLPPYHM